MIKELGENVEKRIQFTTHESRDIFFKNPNEATNGINKFKDSKE
jgi:hypothetical protein